MPTLGPASPSPQSRICRQLPPYRHWPQRLPCREYPSFKKHHPLRKSPADYCSKKPLKIRNFEKLSLILFLGLVCKPLLYKGFSNADLILNIFEKKNIFFIFFQLIKQPAALFHHLGFIQLCIFCVLFQKGKQPDALFNHLQKKQT